MLVASGFKVITPKTAAQKQKLQNLPAGQVTMMKKGKKTYYIFPDPAHNQAYVGGPKEYQAYQQLRAEKKLSREDLQDAEMYQDATMEWSVGRWRRSVGTNGWANAGRVLNRGQHQSRLEKPDAVIRRIPPGPSRRYDQALWALH